MGTGRQNAVRIFRPRQGGASPLSPPDCIGFEGRIIPPVRLDEMAGSASRLQTLIQETRRGKGGQLPEIP